MMNLFQKNSGLSVCLFALSLWLPSLAWAQTIPLTITDQGEAVRVEMQLPPGTRAKSFSLKQPPRLVVDVPNQGSKPELVVSNQNHGDLVRQWRSGQFNATTGRIVLELGRQFNMVSSQQGNMLVVLLTPHGDVVPAQKAQEPEPPKPEPKIIILDAGHGGKDSGALGKHGTKEKDLVLTFVKQFKTTLERTGKYKVVLTRAGDYYIPLRERLAFARKNKASIFLSLHADSASADARGLSVYTLSDTASDKEAAALAAKENRSDIIAGVDLEHHDKDVANILISLAQRETNNQSAILADTLVTSLGGQGIALLNRPHRFAGFAVLKAPDVPSVLVEIGFLSNSDEEKALNKDSYRSKLASGLAKAIEHYFDSTSHAFE